jgi:hypothetical protein
MTFVLLPSVGTVMLKFDVKSAVNQTYNEANMMSIGRKFDPKPASLRCSRVRLGDPEATPSPVNTMSTSPTSSTRSTSLTSSTGSSTSQVGPASDSSNNTEGGVNVGAIVGGALQNVDSE